MFSAMDNPSIIGICVRCSVICRSDIVPRAATVDNIVLRYGGSEVDCSVSETTAELPGMSRDRNGT